MPQYEYAIAVGHDQTVLTNVEDLITYAPFGKPIPLGSVKRKTLDRNEQTNGNRIITWAFGAMSGADFQTLILFIFGDFETENADVTIDTRDLDTVFKRCNGIAHLPTEGVDYQTREHGSVEGLVVTIDDITPFSDSAFSTDFSLDFAS